MDVHLPALNGHQGVNVVSGEAKLWIELPDPQCHTGTLQLDRPVLQRKPGVTLHGFFFCLCHGLALWSCGEVFNLLVLVGVVASLDHEGLAHGVLVRPGHCLVDPLVIGANGLP